MPQKMAFGLSANSAMEVIKILDAKAVLAMALLRATIPTYTSMYVQFSSSKTDPDRESAKKTFGPFSKSVFSSCRDHRGAKKK